LPLIIKVDSAMPLGALNDLPLKSSDFASVCFTARVPERHLRLVIVRLVPAHANGATNYERCRSTALLFDARSPVVQLRQAIFDAVRSTLNVAPAKLERAHLYTRISGSVVPVDVDSGGQSSVATESVVAGGCLRGSSHMGNALHAYTKHCESKTPLCISTAARVYEACTRERTQLRMSQDERHFSAMYLQGLRRLGVANPTTHLPSECMCTGQLTCDCFMRRAMWRAGNMWLIFYVVMPPTDEVVRAPTSWCLVAVTPPQAPPLTTDVDVEWIGKLIDADTASGDTSPLRTVRPSDWHRTTNEYTELTGVTPVSAVEAVARLTSATADEAMFALDGDDDSSASSSTCSLSSAGLSLLEAATVWALECDDFLVELGAASHSLGLYYRAMLHYVLSKAQRRHFVARTVRRARQLARAIGDAHFMRAMRPCDDGLAALGASIALVVEHESAAEPRTLRSCRSTGYALVVVVAVLMCCQRLNSTVHQAATTWPAYVHVALANLGSRLASEDGVDSSLSHKLGL